MINLVLQHLKIDRLANLSVYLQVSNGFIDLIRRGILKPGSPLPPTRVLASALEIHRKTVIAAYQELYAQSYTDTIKNKGMFVSAVLPDIAPRPISRGIGASGVNKETFFPVERKIGNTSHFVPAKQGNLVFNDGFPDIRIAPLELLVREYRRIASYHFTNRFLMYGPEQGSENLRRELSSFLYETRGLRAGPDDILITRGAQMAIFLTAQILLSAGDTVIVGDPGYSGANEIFLEAGAKLALVPVDGQGIDIDSIEDLCKRGKKVRIVYVIPHHHTPTTVTLSPERRMRLLDLARTYNFAVIEDDYDFDFHYASSPILPLASADDCGSVIYIGSFCKTIAPGIRMGFMVAPKNLLAEASLLRKLIDRQGEHLMEEAMANLLHNGDIGRHLKKANRLYRQRRDILCKLLAEHLKDHITFKVPDGGFAVWITFLNGIDPGKLAKNASDMGLTISSATDYYHDKSKWQPSIRLGFASLNNEELFDAVMILKKAILKLSGMLP
jgi:GntR family transcriptional regulator/MocR family aminotransferase